MSDSSAQPAQKMVSRFVGNPNSAIGSLLKKSILGTTQNQSVQTPPLRPASDKSVSDLPADLNNFNNLAISSDLKTPTNDALDLLSEAIAEVETDEVGSASETDVQTGLLSQVVPQIIADKTNTLNPQYPVGSAGSKESVESVSLDQVAVDAARGAQQVELEPTPEIPPEVESYLQKVEDHEATAPKEIVIADGSNTQPTDHHYPAQPVVVLPITPEEEKQGATKSPKFSIRWLVEWSRKIMKVFSGKVVYRFVEEDQK